MKSWSLANVAGVRVHYVDRGKGPAVVLVHGFASSLETWSSMMPALEKKGFRVIALDLKGFGWTDRPEGDYSPDAEAKLIYGLLDQRGVDRFALVAHSWGSSVALAAALQQPARVTRLSLFYSERSDEKMAMAFYDPSVIPEKLVDDVERALGRPGAEAGALAAVRGQHFLELQAKYKGIKQPTLLLWGREDVVTTLRFGERLSHDLPNAKLVVYPLCGHFPMIESASASTADLETFLEPELTAAQQSPTPPDDAK